MKTMTMAALIAILALSAATPSIAQESTSTLVDARVGEWALYQTANGNMQERHSVIARRRDVIVVKVDSIINGKVISSKTENHRITDPAFLRNSEGSTVVTAGGKEYESVVVKRGKRTRYYSNLVPVLGLVRIERDDVMILEVIDHGN